MAPAATGFLLTAEQMETGASLEQSSGEDEQLSYAPRPQRPRWFSSKRPLFLAAVAAVLVVAAVAGVANRGGPRGDVKASVQLFSDATFSEAAGQLGTAGAMLATAGTAAVAMHNITVLGKHMEETSPLVALKAKVTAHPEVSELKVNVDKMNDMSSEELLHPEGQDLHDGNVCPDDEELLEGLCYKKCSTLTEGKYPVRSSAFSCCMGEPCSFFNSKFSNPLTSCDGYDVTGDAEGKECPHVPGDCMENEEFSMGVCYKKCAILTNNDFPYRSAEATCCRYNNHAACLDVLNTVTKPEFNVGGGDGDSSAETPDTAHPPMPQLTEA